jgi:hypothetical protein
VLLIDPDDATARWSTEELLDYLNLGVQTLVGLKPDEFTQLQALPISAGALSLPAGGLQVLDLLSVDGRAVSRGDRTHADRNDPTWRITDQPATHWFSDPRHPRHAWVYPGGQAESALVLYSVAVDEAADIASTLEIPAMWGAPLTYWTVAHAYMKNATRGDLGKSQSFLTLFNQAIELRSGVQARLQPTTPVDQRPVPRVSD